MCTRFCAAHIVAMAIGFFAIATVWTNDDPIELDDSGASEPVARLGYRYAEVLKGDHLAIVSVNLAPASWLRMFEFNGHVSREQSGLVLNVFDRIATAGARCS